MFISEKYHTFHIDGFTFNVSYLDLNYCRTKKNFILGIKNIREASRNKDGRCISLVSAKSVADEIIAMTPEQFEGLFETVSNEKEITVLSIDELSLQVKLQEARISVLESKISALNRKVNALRIYGSLNE